MNIREALLVQSPSLALQRAAGDEISRLDRRIAELEILVDNLRDENESISKELEQRDATNS